MEHAPGGTISWQCNYSYRVSVSKSVLRRSASAWRKVGPDSDLYTVEFETAWKNYTGLQHAHFLNSNTVGLQLALELFKTKYGWNEDDEVITTPLTFVSTNHAILHAGLKPVFADVDEYLCLDPDSVIKLVTEKTKALIFVGMGGNTGRYQKILDICEAHDIKLVLDAAHMSGTRVDGMHEEGCRRGGIQFPGRQEFSNCGFSGMICFRQAEDDERVRKLTWLGINKDTYARTATQGAYKWMYDVEEVGYKYHGNSIMAAIAIVQLKYLDVDNSYRRQLATWYRQHLEGHNRVSVVPNAKDCESPSICFRSGAECDSRCWRSTSTGSIREFTTVTTPTIACTRSLPAPAPMPRRRARSSYRCHCICE